MTAPSQDPEVNAQQAYEVGATVLLFRARRELKGSEAVPLFSGAAERWYRVTPWAELEARDKEFWEIVAGLLNQAKISVKGVGVVLDMLHQSAVDDRKKKEAVFAKYGKLFEG